MPSLDAPVSPSRVHLYWHLRYPKAGRESIRDNNCMPEIYCACISED